MFTFDFLNLHKHITYVYIAYMDNFRIISINSWAFGIELCALFTLTFDVSHRLDNGWASKESEISAVSVYNVNNTLTRSSTEYYESVRIIMRLGSF